MAELCDLFTALSTAAPPREPVSTFTVRGVPRLSDLLDYCEARAPHFKHLLLADEPLCWHLGAQREVSAALLRHATRAHGARLLYLYRADALAVASAPPPPAAGGPPPPPAAPGPWARRGHDAPGAAECGAHRPTLALPPAVTSRMR